MFKKLSNEFLKLKDSKLVYFMIGTIIFMPVTLLMLVIVLNSDQRYDSVTYLEYMAMILKFYLTAVGVTLYNWIAAAIVAREFRMDTLKSQLTIPISRTSFLLIKLIFISLILMGMTLASFFLGTIISVAMEIKGFTLNVTYELLLVYIKAGILMLPFAYFTVLLVLISRQTLMPMIINTLILISTSLINDTKWLTLFPWTAPYKIVFVTSVDASINTAYLSIYLLGIISIYLAYRYINRMEI